MIVVIDYDIFDDVPSVAQIEEIKALAATGGHVFSVTQVCAQALGEAISRARAELVAGVAPGSPVRAIAAAMKPERFISRRNASTYVSAA